jgi:hypothetical protein
MHHSVIAYSVWCFFTIASLFVSTDRWLQHGLSQVLQVPSCVFWCLFLFITFVSRLAYRLVDPHKVCCNSFYSKCSPVHVVPTCAGSGCNSFYYQKQICWHYVFYHCIFCYVPCKHSLSFVHAWFTWRAESSFFLHCILLLLNSQIFSTKQ